MEDGRTRYNKVTKLLEPIVGQTLHKNKIWRRVMLEIGSSRNTVREVMVLMINLGMIKETKADFYKIISNKADI